MRNFFAFFLMAVLSYFVSPIAGHAHGSAPPGYGVHQAFDCQHIDNLFTHTGQAFQVLTHDMLLPEPPLIERQRYAYSDLYNKSLENYYLAQTSLTATHWGHYYCNPQINLPRLIKA